LSPSPRALVVVTGSELVRGDRRDLNGPFLARELVSLGVNPAEIVIVGDSPQELEAALRSGLEADLCVVSGGLGLLVVVAVGSALLLAQLLPDPRIGGLPLVALLGVAGAVIAIGIVIHPGIRRAAERWTERSLLERSADPATDDGDH